MNDSIPVIGGMITLLMLVLLYVWFSLALAALFRKAGEDGWQGWVPVLNTAVLFRLGGYSPWFVLTLLLPVVGVVFLGIAYHRINRAFGLGGGMTVLALLLPIVWASIVGFGSSRWIGAAPAPARGRSGFEPASAPAFAPGPAFLPPAGAAPAFAPAPAPPRPAPPAPSPAAAGTGFWAPPPPASAPPPLPAGIAPRPGAPAVPPMPPPPSFSRSAPLGGGLEDSAVDPEDRLPASAAVSVTIPPASASEPSRRAAPPVPIESIPEPEPEPPIQRPSAWAPAAVRAPASSESDGEGFPELSEAVSAVAGAPDAGAPRSARSSVSALYTQPEIADDDLEAMDRTIVARRRRILWTLIPPGGAPVDITADVVILGRRPAPDPEHPGAQLVSIADDTRTVSKTHARLELRGDTWFVTDLESTNGVMFATLMGTEVEAEPGQALEAGERFFLGDAEVRLKRSEG